METKLTEFQKEYEEKRANDPPVLESLSVHESSAPSGTGKEMVIRDHSLPYFDETHSKRETPYERPSAVINVNWRFWKPRTDIFEVNDTVVVEFELPGVSLDEISVTLADDMLTLQSVKNKTKKEQLGEYYLRERHFGNFYRRVVLPEYVDGRHHKATLDNGLLRISFEIVPLEKVSKKSSVVTIQPHPRTC